ncbi:MAG: hypothetical protein ACI3W9_03600 [Eubacteriales bacterium]
MKKTHIKTYLPLLLILILLISLSSCYPHHDVSDEPSEATSKPAEESDTEKAPEWEDTSLPEPDRSVLSKYEEIFNGVYRLPADSAYTSGAMFVCGGCAVSLTYGDGGCVARSYLLSEGAFAEKTVTFSENAIGSQLDNAVGIYDMDSGSFTVIDGMLNEVYSFRDPSLEGIIPMYVFTADGEYVAYLLFGESSLKSVRLSDGSPKTAEIPAGSLYLRAEWDGKMLIGSSESECDYTVDIATAEVTETEPRSDIAYSRSVYVSSTTYPMMTVDKLGTDLRAMMFATDLKEGYFSDYRSGTLLMGSVYEGLRVYDLCNEIGYSLCDYFDETPISDAYISDTGFVIVRAGYEDKSMYLWDFRASGGTELNAEFLTPGELEQKAEALRQELFDSFGIEVFYGTEGNDFVSDEYLSKTVTEFNSIYPSLVIIKDTLSLYPDGMIEEMCAGSVKSIDIYLSGGLYSITESGINSAAALTYTYGDTRVLVADIDSNFDLLRQNIVHELMHIADDRISEKETEDGTGYLSGWTELVPPGWNYFYSYHDEYGNEMNDYSYTSSDGGNFWFVDAYSKSFPTEDRARIMENLVLSYDEGGLNYALDSDNMRMKARYLCVIIRIAFDSARNADTLPWEEYLGEIDTGEFDFPDCESAE